MMFCLIRFDYDVVDVVLLQSAIGYGWVCYGYFGMMGRLMLQVGLLYCRGAVVGGMLLVCR